MAQYDILLTQNTASSGVDFQEKYVNIAKGGLLSANASGVPTVLPAGTDGYFLSRDAATATGLSWISTSSILGSLNALRYQGVFNGTGNPDYPAATVGDVYVVSVVGKVGGTSGTLIEPDLLFCIRFPPRT